MQVADGVVLLAFCETAGVIHKNFGHDSWAKQEFYVNSPETPTLAMVSLGNLWEQINDNILFADHKDFLDSEILIACRNIL